MNNKIDVAIYMVTYNHERYIAQAIEGIIKQQTKYIFKLFIGEDCSTDATNEICFKYQNSYPDLIEVISTKINNLKQNVNNIFAKCFTSSAKYIAICESDDYWTDPNKLQKQVDFLEANPGYAICFSGYTIKNEINNTENVVIPETSSISIENIIQNNNYATATTVFAAEYFKPVPSWFHKIHFGDWALYLTVLYNSKKKAYCLPDVTSVYRIHRSGIHGNMQASNIKLVNAYKQHIDFYRTIQSELFGDSYAGLIKKCISDRKKYIASLLKKERKPIAALLSRFY